MVFSRPRPLSPSHPPPPSHLPFHSRQRSHLSPTITLTPAVSNTPTVTTTPHMPLAVEALFQSTITPNADAVFSKLTFTDGLDSLYRPLKPGEVFQQPDQPHVRSLQLRSNGGRLAMDGPLVSWRGIWFTMRRSPGMAPPAAWVIPIGRPTLRNGCPGRMKSSYLLARFGRLPDNLQSRVSPPPPSPARPRRPPLPPPARVPPPAPRDRPLRPSPPPPHGQRLVPTCRLLQRSNRRPIPP